MSPIDPRWLQGYVNELLEVANKLPENNPLRERLTFRAEAILDMVEVWKKRRT